MTGTPRFVSGPARYVVLASIALTVILLALGLGPLLLRGQRNQRLLREGTRATATVRDIRPTGGSHNDDPEITLKLEVAAGPNDHFEAEVVTFLSPVYLPRFQPGAVVDVYYDPKDRSQVALVSP